MRLQIDPRSDTSLDSNSDSQQLLDYLGLLHPVLLQTKGSHLTLGLLQLETPRLLLQTKGSHLTLGFLQPETLRLLLQTKCSHLTLGFLHRRSAKQTLPTATAAPQPPGHGNIFFCSIIIWTLLCILHGSSNTLYTDLTVGVPLAGTPPVSRTSRSSSDSLSRRSNRLSVAPVYHKIINCRNHPQQFGAHRGAPAIHRLN